MYPGANRNAASLRVAGSAWDAHAGHCRPIAVFTLLCFGTVSPTALSDPRVGAPIETFAMECCIKGRAHTDAYGQVAGVGHDMTDSTR